MAGQTEPAKSAEKDLYPKVRGVSTKRPCEGSPPSGEERWHMRRGLSRTTAYLGMTNVVVIAKTFFAARQEAAVTLGCEPGELTGEML